MTRFAGICVIVPTSVNLYFFFWPLRISLENCDVIFVHISEVFLAWSDKKTFFKMSVILFTWINKGKYIEKSFCHKLQLRLTVLSGSMWLFYHSWEMCLTNYTPTSHLFSLNSHSHLLANTRNQFFAGDCFLARYQQRATHSRLHKWRGARQAETTAKCISLQQHWFIQ